MRKIFHPRYLILYLVFSLLCAACQKGFSIDYGNSPVTDTTGIDSTGTDSTGTDTTVTPPGDTTAPGDKDTVIAGTLAYEISYFTSGNVYSDLHYFAADGRLGQIKSDYYPMRRIYYNSAGKIARIDTYFGDDNSGFGYAYSANFTYDQSGNVIAQVQTDSSGSYPDTLYTYAYNTQGQMTEKTEYNNNVPDGHESYTYDANGNVVQLAGGGAVYTITYDNRPNRFNDTYPQYQFLDAAIAFDYTDRDQVFYNSKNYPVTMTPAGGGDPVQVYIDVTTDGKPASISFNGKKWYSYAYN